RALALLLLQQDEEITGLVRDREGEGYKALAEQVREISFERRESFHLDLSLERNKMVRNIVTGVFSAPEKRVVTFAERLSRLAVQPLTGVPLLLIVLYFGLYQFVGSFGAGTLVDLLETQGFKEHFNPWITDVINGIIPWEIIRELFVGEYGVIT